MADVLLPPIPAQAPILDDSGAMNLAWTNWFLAIKNLIQAPTNGGSLSGVPISGVSSGNQVSGFTFATGAYIREGQTAYNTGTGFWLGDVGGIPKFSIGNSAGASLLWDGSALAVTGPNITLGQGTVGFSASAAYKFARDTALHFGQTGDVFAVYSEDNGSHQILDIENTVKGLAAGSGGGNADARILLTATGWNASTALSGNPAVIALRADPATSINSNTHQADQHVFYMADGSTSGLIFEGNRSAAMGHWTTYTPTTSGLSLGNGVVTGFYTLTGNTCNFVAQLVVGSTTTFSSTITLGLPFTAKARSSGGVEPIGPVNAYNGSFHGGQTYYASATAARFLDLATNTFYTGAVPFAWTTNNVLGASGSYEIA